MKISVISLSSSVELRNGSNTCSLYYCNKMTWGNNNKNVVLIVSIARKKSGLQSSVVPDIATLFPIA